MCITLLVILCKLFNSSAECVWLHIVIRVKCVVMVTSLPPHSVRHKRPTDEVRQTDRRTNRQPNRQTDKQVERRTNKQPNRQTNK